MKQLKINKDWSTAFKMSDITKKELICIVCPKGCHLTVTIENDTITNDIHIVGNECKRGEAYAKAETTNPTRVLTSTVMIKGGYNNRLPVKTNTPIPKGMVLEVMALLNNIEVTSPIKCGDIIVKDIANTGANLVATRDM